jgi:hypothetical protein
LADKTEAAGNPAAFLVSECGLPANVAMQKQRCCYAIKCILLASGIHLNNRRPSGVPLQVQEKGDIMSKTAAVALSPSTSLLGRLLASIDRLLMKSAEIAVRNGDLPRFGL